MMQVYRKYILQKVRMKISYQCLINRMINNEHWIRQIVRSFRFLRDSNQIQVPFGTLMQEMEKFPDKVADLNDNILISYIT